MFHVRFTFHAAWLWAYYKLTPVVWSDTAHTETDSTWSRSCQSFSRPLHASRNSQALRFEFLTVLSVNIIVMWDVTPYVLIRDYKSCGKTVAFIGVSDPWNSTQKMTPSM